MLTALACSLLVQACAIMRILKHELPLSSSHILAAPAMFFGVPFFALPSPGPMPQFALPPSFGSASLAPPTKASQLQLHHRITVEAGPPISRIDAVKYRLLCRFSPTSAHLTRLRPTPPLFPTPPPAVER
ncbi:hypothetical protein AB1N83_012235 [Pleurotus pulmonarius]